MRSVIDNGVLTVFLSGHIDSLSARDVEKELLEIVDDSGLNTIMLDVKDLEYISSSGLRIMLKLKKMKKELSIINASSSVYDIFEVTGFTELIDISKAMREVSIDGCEMIGEGANGKVYHIDSDTIVKVYKSHVSLEDIRHERELSRTAFVLGIPTAIAYDVVKVGGGYGSVFEMLNARSLCSLMLESEDNLETVASKSVEIAKIIHSTPAPKNLPDETDLVKEWHKGVLSYFTDEENTKLDSMLDALPRDGMMIHGDFHIKNLLQQNDETLLIDMDTLSTGHPIFELAFMYNSYKGYGLVDRSAIEDFMGFSIELADRLWRRMLALYIGTDDEQIINETEDKASLIGLLRLLRRQVNRFDKDTEKGRAFIAAAQEKMKAVLKRIDTLEFETYES